MEIFAAIDIETTGLDFSKCEMIELAIVPLNRDFSLSAVPEFIARIKAEHPETAEAQALQVNGLNPADGDSRAKALENLLCWLTDNGIERIIPVAQNLEFDMRFITQTSHRFRRCSHGTDGTVCDWHSPSTTFAFAKPGNRSFPRFRYSR